MDPSFKSYRTDKLTVLEKYLCGRRKDQPDRNSAWYFCKCDCGKEAIFYGDEICLTIHPATSKATLISDSKVNYQGKEMSINEWGCLVTGWKSICIYYYARKTEDSKTFHQMRMEYLSRHPELKGIDFGRISPKTTKTKTLIEQNDFMPLVTALFDDKEKKGVSKYF